MKDRMKQLKSKAGMTYVELLVAFTLLVFIIMAFSPMLLKSYDWVYRAGERVSDTYEAKSELEKELSIREDDELVNNGNGIAVNMRKFTNQFAIQMRRVTTEVNGLETIYGVGKAELRIISSEVVADNQSYYPIVVRLVNFEGTSVSIGTTFSSDKSKIIIDVKSLLKDDTGIKYSVKSENIDKNIIKVIIENADITYSPFEMTAYYYDEYGRKRTTTSHVFISEPDLMLAGKSTAEAQYLTSAGVVTDDSGKESMIVAARKMEDMAVPAGTKINKVRWLSTYDGSDLGIRTGTYAMCGIQEDGNAFIRRLWNLDSEGGATYSKVYKADGVVYVNNIAYYKYIWGSDYTQPVTRGWVKYKKNLVSDNVTDAVWSTTYSLNDSYNNVVAKNMQNTLYAGTNYLMQLCKTYSGEYMSAKLSEAVGDNVSSGYAVLNRHTNIITTFGGQMPNLEGGDGYSGINLSTVRKRTNGWVSYIDFNATGLTANYSSSNANIGGKNQPSSNGQEGDHTDPTYKIARKGGDGYEIANANHYLESAVPILFFAADGQTSPTQINRYFIPENNNWGSQLQSMQYGIYRKSFGNIHTDTRNALGFCYFDNVTSSFVDANHHPLESDVDNILFANTGFREYHNIIEKEKKSGYQIFHNYISDWSCDRKTGGNAEHYCWGCDVPARFTEQITTNGGKYIINPNDTLTTRQQKIMDLILDNMGIGDGEKVVIPAVSPYTGDPNYPSGYKEADKKDEMCSFIRLKSFTNLNGTFNEDFAASGNLTVDSSLTQKAEGKKKLDGYGFDNNDNRSDVELTDVFYIKDSSDATLNVVYTGVTPASSFLYGPYVNTAAVSAASNAYTIYFITSYGDDGFAIYSKENIGHNAYDVTTFDKSFWSGRRYLKTASYTLGYSSNYNLIFGNLADTALDNYSNSPLNLTKPTGDYDNKLDNYTKDFYNITTFTESEGYTFAVGYRVIGYAGVDSTAIAIPDTQTFKNDFEDTCKKQLGVTNIYYTNSIADFFTDANFKSVAGATQRYYNTYKNDMATEINKSKQDQQVAAFYFDIHDDQNAAYITSLPTAVGAAYTALTGVKVASGKEGDASIPCNAVANEGVIEYMNPGDTSFTQLKFTFASDTPYNYKFTDVSFVKTGGKIEKDGEGNVIVDDPDKLELILSASNGCVYHGTLDFTITTSTVQATDPVTGEPLFVEDKLGNKTPVYEQTAVINPGQVVQLSSINCSDLSQVRTVSTAKYEKDDGSTVTVLLAAGKPKASNTAIYASTDLGVTWTEVTASSTTYDIYDIQASGEYVYAVGTTSDGSKGVVLYKKTSSCSTNSAWTAVTQYSKTFKTVGLGADLVGSDKVDLPPIYTCASKSA